MAITFVYKYDTPNNNAYIWNFKKDQFNKAEKNQDKIVRSNLN